jgi:hypothetical protein
MLIGTIIVLGILLVLVLVILLVVGVLVQFIGIIMLLIAIIKKKYNNPYRRKLLVVLSIIGIMGGLLLQLPFGGMLLLTSFKNSDIDSKVYIETNTFIYWEGDTQYELHYPFVYNNRTYKHFLSTPTGTEKGAPVANIYHTPKEKDKKEKPWMRLWQFTWNRILGDKPSKGEVIFTVKNCDDFSLLSVGGHNPNSTSFNLFCDANLITEKRIYYGTGDNYDSFISRTYETVRHSKGYEIAVRPLSENDYTMFKDIQFSENDNTIDISRKKSYEYVNIFVISKDNIMKKQNNSFLIDNDTIYTYKTVGADTFHATPLSDEQIAYIFSLLE